MLVSTVKKNSEYDYAKFRIGTSLSDLDQRRRGDSNRGGFDVDFRRDQEKLFVGYCEPVLNDFPRAKESNDFDPKYSNRHEAEQNALGDGLTKNGHDVKRLSKKIAEDLGWDSDDEARDSGDMRSGAKNLVYVNDKSYPTRFSPEDGDVTGDHFCPDLRYPEIACRDKYMTKNESSLPTTSKNLSQDMSAYEESNLDIFDLNICSDSYVTDCGKLFSEKDDLTINSDLVNKYEKKLGLDIIKDKNVCWAAGNIENEVCPLRSYEPDGGENSSWSFSKDHLDVESRESFSQGWAFDESIEDVTEDHVDDTQVIIPKKAVDITKIKGWRKKQFTMEKCLANNNSVLKNKCLKMEKPKEPVKSKETVDKSTTDCDDQSKDYAFVCDSLDDFLDQEAELKINYEIPHLYAEYGIKLTSEDLVSRPKFAGSEFGKGKLVVPKTNRGPEPKTDRRPEPMEKNSRKLPKLSAKPSPTNKCALPKKSAVIKEEPKAKETTAATTPAVPCRRSNRIMLAANRSHMKEEADRESNSRAEVIHRKKLLVPKPAKALNKPQLSGIFRPDYLYKIRRLGMVVFPGPSNPLNPVVQFHLQKIRSYRTLIDNKWANFAVSALSVKGKPSAPKRMILPVTCCFKYKKETENKTDLLAEQKPTLKTTKSTSRNDVLDDVKATMENLVSRVCDMERVFIKEEPPIEIYDYLECCVEEMNTEVESVKEPEPDVDIVDVEGGDGDDVIDVTPATVTLPPNLRQMFVDKTIAKLLSRRLKKLKLSQTVNNSIDTLKQIRPNSLELVKLNFIKENFLSGYINLWYIRSRTGQKPRVILTFTMNTPLEGAVNLKVASRLSRRDLPKIINDIVEKQSFFDPNDLAILYCEGNVWEIHGSVNFTRDKADNTTDEKTQVFHLATDSLPELRLLHEISDKSDEKRVVKWWVMHMLQEYTDLYIKLGDDVGHVSRSVILHTWKSKVPGFIAFKGLRGDRPMGVAVNPRLWPYFLVGPYHVGENHCLTLKLQSQVLPFEYSLPLDRVKPNFLLKRFVSSVIMHLWRNCKQVVGMWLYDRTETNMSTFIEVKTKVKKTGNYESVVEHDYSLSQTDDDQFEVKLNGVHPEIKRLKEKKADDETEEVFLVPSVSNLGYVKGEMHSDMSISIEHPLKPERRIRTQHIGDWLNKMMKRRIKYVPNDFEIKWKIVKRDSISSSQKPLDKFSLGGTHLVCSKGLFYLLSLTKERIQSLELDEASVMNAIIDNPIIREVIELKELGKILLQKDSCELQMSEVLQLALNEIKKLEKQDLTLRKLKAVAEKQRELLCRRYIRTLETCNIEENTKKAIHFYINRILGSGKNKSKRSATDDGKCREWRTKNENFQCLEAIHKFLINNLMGEEDAVVSPNGTSPSEDIVLDEEVDVEDKDTSKVDNGKTETKCGGDADDDKKSNYNNDIVQKLESKIKDLYDMLRKSNSDDGSLEELKSRLATMSEHLQRIKNGYVAPDGKKPSSNVNGDGRERPESGESDRSRRDSSDGSTTPANGEYDYLNELWKRERWNLNHNLAGDVRRSAEAVEEKPVKHRTRVSLLRRQRSRRNASSSLPDARTRLKTLLSRNPNFQSGVFPITGAGAGGERTDPPDKAELRGKSAYFKAAKSEIKGVEMMEKTKFTEDVEEKGAGEDETSSSSSSSSSSSCDIGDDVRIKPGAEDPETELGKDMLGKKRKSEEEAEYDSEAKQLKSS